MKLWEILKAENVGKTYRSSDGIVYLLKYDKLNNPVLFNDGLALPFNQTKIITLDFQEVSKGE